MSAHDPTRIASSPVQVAKGAVVLSLSETHALCAKAARGVGFDWGHAEEAGHAAAWLAARTLPGCALILRRLQMGPDALTPAQSVQCPLRIGVALVDHVNLPEAAQDYARLVNIALPGLVLPFVGLAARLRGADLGVVGNGQDFSLHADGAAPNLAAMSAFCDLPVGDIRLKFGPRQMPPVPQKKTCAPLRSTPMDIWRALDALALRVTVPPSDHSLGGAGGDGSDND